MKVEVTQQAKLKSALALTREQRLYDAMCLFSQVDGYEGLLNRIICLCSTENLSEATDLYMLAKHKYGQTHAVYSDLAEYRGISDLLFAFCEEEWGKPFVAEGSIRADKSLLVDLSDLDEPSSIEDLFDPVFDVSDDIPLFDDPRYADDAFYDVRSEDYFNSLRIRMEKCFFRDDDAGATKYAQKLLELETDHLPTLEMQISLLLHNRQFRQAIPYIKRLAASDTQSPALLHDATTILRRLGMDNYLPLLSALMHKALNLLEEIDFSDLEEYAYYALQYLNDVDLARKFATEMFDNYQLITFTRMKVCAISFYNCGDVNKALDAAFAILHAVPNDVFARLFVEYLRQSVPTDGTPMEILMPLQRHIAIPSAIMVYVRDKTREYLHSSHRVLTEQLLLYVSALIKNCKTLAIAEEYNDEYYSDLDLARKVLGRFKPCNMQDFADFVTAEIYFRERDVNVQLMLLESLINHGFRDNIIVSCADCKYYRLDLSKLSSANPVFVKAFAICATLLPVQPGKLERAYAKLSETVGIPDDAFKRRYQIAFAMLSLVNPRFPKSKIAKSFTLEDRALYFRYCERLDELKNASKQGK